ncbi:ATP-binding protein [Paracoccus benzoatiresistens]|uniref:histidine kinase n=1 Tax=Paracoccus benzoatiresistens TaxID=2997341 RepID=A0ABT4IYU9_9RHOB|nr:ATP-binding protein [Paracoccus sp. EF6]MCZ0960040.1 histidine kinase [Paracoccus sp. EF6]
MNRLSLTQRILLVILAVQAALFGALAAASLESARRDIATETRLAVETARALVLATVGTMQGAVPPDRIMQLLPERLVVPRHVTLGIVDAVDGVVRRPPAPVQAPAPAPRWFAALVAPDPLETRMPVAIEGRPRGYVFIAADPGAEIALAWRDLSAFLGLAALAALVQAGLILLATRHALRPVAVIASRLADLRRGDLSARVGPVPQRDLAGVAAGVDDLAQALVQAQADRARLQRRVITRGDEERKAIARDLHDEMGPCLFGLRVEVDALREAATSPAIEAHATSIAQIAEEIARVNRALLGDLRPAAIGQLPLSAVLSDYVGDLGRRFPDLDIDLDLPPGLPEPDEATALTLFRILQEGTTNALRHAGADRVTVRLWTDPAHWRMELRDNGRGMAPGAREGTGLTGMRERITLLGGDLRLSSGAGGTTIAASLPLQQPEEGSP